MSSFSPRLATVALLQVVVATTLIAQQQNTPAAVAIDSVMSVLYSLDLSPGIGVVVVRDTQIVYMKGFGMADVASGRPFTPETVFYIASTTKSFTGLAAAILDSQGKFRLDAPLSRYLPNVKLHEPLNPDSITIRSLLTHTHGIGNGGPVVIRLAYTGVYNGDAELARLLAEHPPARTGRAYSYGNLGYNVAALAMDASTGESWKRTLERLLFKPLGMTKTSAYVSRFSRSQLATPYELTLAGWKDLPYGKTDANMQSAGGLVSTLRDLGTWLEVHINNGQLDGKQILPASAVSEAHKNLAQTDASTHGGRNIGYGLGWRLIVTGNDTILSHGGGFPGFSTFMSFIPARKIGVAVMANNGDFGQGLAEFATERIYNVLTGGTLYSGDSMPAMRNMIAQAREGMTAAMKRRAARPQNLPYPLEAYTGTFENPSYGRLEISLVNGKLAAKMGVATSAIAVYDNTKNQLRIEIFGGGDVMDVEMKDGRAEVMIFEGDRYTRTR